MICVIVVNQHCEHQMITLTSVVYSLALSFFCCQVEAILREYVSSADGDESSAVPFAPGGKSSPPASSMTGLNIRSRLRGFKDKIKSHAGNDGANTQGDLIGAGAEQREGGYLDRLKNIRK